MTIYFKIESNFAYEGSAGPASPIRLVLNIDYFCAFDAFQCAFLLHLNI